VTPLGWCAWSCIIVHDLGLRRREPAATVCGMTRIALSLITCATAVLVSAPANALSACAYEDGNPDGAVCIWTDPDTATTYAVDSANYR